MGARRVSALALLVLFCSCTSVPPPEPEAPGSAGLCIELRTRVPIGFFTHEVDQVYFAKLPPGVDDARQGQLYASNHVDGEYVYLLNAPPGEYVAVLAVRHQSGGPPAPPPQGGGFSVGLRIGDADFTTFFDEDLVRDTRTTVVPGAIAFMGAYEVEQAVGLSDADPTQLHFIGLLAPDAEDRGLLGSVLTGDCHYRGSLIEASHDPRTETAFRRDASKHLAETGWASILPH